MALPKLNNSPKYEMTIPSSKETVRFRPFLIKEEKNMLIAAESGNTANVLNALMDTLKACIDGDINETKLATFDVEYMFLQLRSKSVGETAKVGIKCAQCGTQNELHINLEDLNLSVPDINKTIQLTDDIKVELDWPSYSDLLSAGVDTDSFSNTEQLFKMIQYCFKTVITENERINLKEVSNKELGDFIDSLNGEQFSKIREFIEQIPRLRKEYSITCKSCNHENVNTLEGLSNFLS